MATTRNSPAVAVPASLQNQAGSSQAEAEAEAEADADAGADTDADKDPEIWFPYLKTKQTQTQTTMGALAAGGLTNPASNRVPPQTTRPVGAHTNPGWTTIEIGNGVSYITAHGRTDILYRYGTGSV